MTLKRIRTKGGLTRYRHPAGFVIEQAERDWDGRGYRDGFSVGPKRWWEVVRYTTPTRFNNKYGSERHPIAGPFTTLREARAWCDEQAEDSQSPADPTS